MNDRTYIDGVRDGKIQALETNSKNHKERLDHHSGRLRWLERIVWGLCGAIILIEMTPKLLSFLDKTPV